MWYRTSTGELFEISTTIRYAESFEADDDARVSAAISSMSLSRVESKIVDR